MHRWKNKYNFANEISTQTQKILYTMDAEFLQNAAPHTLLVVSAGDLQTFAKSVVTQTAAALKADTTQAEIIPAQAARYVGVSVQTLWRWDKEGYLPSHRKGGRKYYYQGELDAIKGVRK